MTLGPRSSISSLQSSRRGSDVRMTLVRGRGDVMVVRPGETTPTSFDSETPWRGKGTGRKSELDGKIQRGKAKIRSVVRLQVRVCNTRNGTMK